MVVVMIIRESKRTKGGFFEGKGLYIAILVCVLAVAAGSWGALKATMDTGEEQSTVEVPGTTIDWDNQGGIVITDESDEQANVTATGIPDIRTQTGEETSVSQVTEPDDNTPFKGYYALPLGTDILKDYSNGEMVKSKTMGDWRVHNGVDFSGAKGNEVLAIQNGTVKSVFNDPMWGTVVEIDHGNGLVAKYCGLLKDSVPAKGSDVEQFWTIGKLGEIPIENADGYHLHLEITVGGKIVDPLAAMNKIGA